MKSPPSSQKLRGGYYTPSHIGDFLADWAVRSAADTVLEPSCGDGALLRAAAGALVREGAHPHDIPLQLHGIELDPTEAQKARRVLAESGIPDAGIIETGDFFAYCRDHLQDRRFDAIIGNPPFIRFQHFPEDIRTIAFELMKDCGLRPNGLTNAWVPFIAAGTRLLTPTGKLAMVVPAELLQVDYAAQLRLYLSNNFSRVTVFTFRELMFEGVQQEVVLLCAEKGIEGDSAINIVELNGTDDLRDYEHVVFGPASMKPMDHSTEKWTQYFLETREIELLRTLKRHPALNRLGNYASVDVGVVTGLNDFFVLTEEQRALGGLSGYTRGLVGRSAQLRGLIFSEQDWQDGLRADAPSYLLSLPELPLDDLSTEAQQYIRAGEANEFHKGYKCRIRKRWYVVPSRWVPDAFMLRQIHRYPKVVVNDARVTCTDTIHRVRLHVGVEAHRLAASCLNSVTFAFSEVLGRSYGGGVLELEPGEAERLPIAYDQAGCVDLGSMDRLLRNNDVETVLDEIDRPVLVDALGLSTKDVHDVRAIWLKLQRRRVARKKRPAARRKMAAS